MNSPRVFKAYGDPGTADYPDLKIWQAARATSAAPRFFKRIRIGPKNLEEEFLDGGLGSNNPTKILLDQTARTFGQAHPVACIISIGCGESNIIEIKNPSYFQRWAPLELVDALKDIATDCRETALEVKQKFESIPGVYFRYNVDNGLQNIGLEEWKEMGQVLAKTIDYVGRVENEMNQAIGAIMNRDGSLRCTVQNLGVQSQS
jgi:hypothetical protein